jgi:lysophospholipase L1-like esterase
MPLHLEFLPFHLSIQFLPTMSHTKSPVSAIVTSLAFLLCVQLSRIQAEILVKEGEKIAFLGDSITAAGYSNAGGYVQLIGAGLAANGAKVELIGAGWSGHKSNQMLERLERDVLSKKPQWMTLSCGVNDVWHGPNGIPLPDYEKNITAIVDRAQQAGIKVVILTSTMITEDQQNPNNQKLVPYNDFLRKLAKEKNCQFADLNADMQAALADARKSPTAKGNLLTTDGVHMAFAGDVMMATGVLKSLGLDTKEMSKAKDAWLDLPNTNVFEPKVILTQRQAEKLAKRAASRNISLGEMIQQEINKHVLSLEKSENP